VKLRAPARGLSTGARGRVVLGKPDAVSCIASTRSGFLVPVPKQRGTRGYAAYCGVGWIYVALDGALARSTPLGLGARFSEVLPSKGGTGPAEPLAKLGAAVFHFAYMVLLNVIRSFWAREGSPENSRPVRNSL
jgi:hypothetical protein